jgi:H+/Cl- antiporter ClcA
MPRQILLSTLVAALSSLVVFLLTRNTNWVQDSQLNRNQSIDSDGTLLLWVICVVGAGIVAGFATFLLLRNTDWVPLLGTLFVYYKWLNETFVKK